MAEQIKPGHHRCRSCHQDKPISAFWKRGGGSEERRRSCAECLTRKARKRQEKELAEPIVQKVLDLIRDHGPMTVVDLVQFIPEKSQLFLGYLTKKMRKHGMIDRVLFSDTRKNSIWYLSGQTLSEEAELEAEAQFELDGKIDISAIVVNRSKYPRGISRDDLEWMQKYRQRAALKLIPRPERSRFEYTA